VGMEFGKGDL
jgi:hypothetical protein